MEQFTKTLELYLVKKAPALPAEAKKTLVAYAHWVAIVGVVLSLPAIFALLGLGSMMASMPFTAYGMYRMGGGFSLAILFLIASSGLMLLSIPGLKAKKMAGWNYAYYGVLLNAVYSLLNTNLSSLVIGTGLSLYLLFQVKGSYKSTK